MDHINMITEMIREEFDNTIIWDQKTEDLVGKYFYINYKEKPLGILLGYKNYPIKSYITLLFIHPMLYNNPKHDIEMILLKLLAKINLQIKNNKYRMIKGNFPALIRTTSEDNPIEFFRESLNAIKYIKPIIYYS
jgi:hypothetical protein